MWSRQSTNTLCPEIFKKKIKSPSHSRFWLTCSLAVARVKRREWLGQLKKNENPRAWGDHASAGLIKPNERQTGAHKKVMRKWVAARGLEESCNVSLFLWWSSSFYYQSRQGTITLCPGIDWATKFGSPLRTSQSVLSLISILGFWLPAFVCSQNLLCILQLCRNMIINKFVKMVSKIVWWHQFFISLTNKVWAGTKNSHPVGFLQ